MEVRMNRIDLESAARFLNTETEYTDEPANAQEIEQAIEALGITPSYWGVTMAQLSAVHEFLSDIRN